MFKPNRSKPLDYVIHIEERIKPRWSAWFDEFEIRQLENGETILSGSIVDQAALHGLLGKIRDLNLTLLSVSRIEPSKH
ncbi:MAG: hypothetical protein ACK2TV_11460 [Anaerolineales bacterium]